MSANSRKTFGYATLALIALGFVVAVVASNVWLRGVRVDLTENDLSTLGEGTQAVLDGIEEPVNLYLFFSDEATATLPTLRAYATRVREMLEEFEANAPDGKLVLNVIDLRDLVYFALLIGGFLYANTIVLELRKAD
jgi:ABC-type uncharacterized transport system involved in gliding motility auxiliary subunit